MFVVCETSVVLIALVNFVTLSASGNQLTFKRALCPVRTLGPDLTWPPTVGQGLRRIRRLLGDMSRNPFLPCFMLLCTQVVCGLSDTSAVTRHALATGWVTWSPWDPCPGRCGPAVTSRTRACRSGESDRSCDGNSKEVKLCKQTACAAEEAGPCQELEARVFGGKRYRWLPYSHPRNVCESACRPMGAGFYLGLGTSLPDGSPCQDDSNVCLEGKCQAVGCDDVVGSRAVYDVCGVCAGDNTSCSTAKYEFTDHVKFGYHTFATIPRGSKNIQVKEVTGSSRNYLAIRAADGSLSINTDFRLTRFGSVDGAGTTFLYSRQADPECPDECITATGPTTVDIDLMVLAYSDNTGIRYSYSVPSQGLPAKGENTAPMVFIDGETDGEGRVSPEDEGEQARVLVVSPPQRMADVLNKTDALQSSRAVVVSIGEDGETDAEAESPVYGGGGDGVAVGDMYRSENSLLSPYSWQISEHTECSQTCGQGKQTAVLKCMVTEKGVAVEDAYCADQERPNVPTQACNYGPCPPSWKRLDWSTCSVTCGMGTQVLKYVCMTTDGQEVASSLCGTSQPGQEARTCDAGSCSAGWYFTEWTDRCSAKCGEGTLTRGVKCVSPAGGGRQACPEGEKPENEKACKGSQCGGIWLTGPWSHCNASCGLAVQTREVVCAFQQDGQIRIVAESACVGEERPPTSMGCDQPQCEPQWFMGAWGQCSMTCGSGYRSRDVRCMDVDGRARTTCPVSSRPLDRQPCKTRLCTDKAEYTSVRRDSNPTPNPISHPGEPECVDSFVQCRQVLHNRLCQYKYYQKICCSSCRRSQAT
ncbi:A disintegrin and metalloproteinase with thrombospondin motifs 16-like isoform X2 [Dreissena polymorpha]|uniref:A disintegrin and metalloproteinase with thrombospondin motifs 16-like isoform X2 n=1 Tax=Dreissena polymorpha TaxID=45954 RepID=UPI0022643D62|nr:A disintegrin and metalloproteinase with thrombospondin motifs 16-like isoform X2 [Dreissena polymorpha]